jgi:CarD family transcriptional regulator
VQKTLGADHAVSRDPWLKRRRNSQAKLASGDPIELAELIRDSARREWTLPAKGTKPQLSPGERELFVKARQLLSNEIALARGVEPSEANAWIDEQLTRTGRSAGERMPRSSRATAHAQTASNSRSKS